MGLSLPRPPTKDEFYDQLSRIIQETSNQEKLLLMGNTGAKVGTDHNFRPSFQEQQASMNTDNSCLGSA